MQSNRKDVLKLAVDKLVNKVTVNRQELDSEIIFSKEGIKHAINKNHSSYEEKNNMILQIDVILFNAPYLGSQPDFHNNLAIKQIHIFETYINNVINYIVLREYKDGSIRFYSISEHEKVVDGIKKIG